MLRYLGQGYITYVNSAERLNRVSAARTVEGMVHGLQFYPLSRKGVYSLSRPHPFDSLGWTYAGL